MVGVDGSDLLLPTTVIRIRHLEFPSDHKFKCECVCRHPHAVLAGKAKRSNKESGINCVGPGVLT